MSRPDVKPVPQFTKSYKVLATAGGTPCPTTWLFGLLERCDQFRHHLEQIADNPIVGNFENRSIRIFIDGYDGARPLHPHQVLNRTGDADGHVQLGTHGLSRTTHLPLHGKPSDRKST